MIPSPEKGGVVRSDGRSLTGPYPSGFLRWGVDVNRHTNTTAVGWGRMREQGCDFLIAKAYDSKAVIDRRLQPVDPIFPEAMSIAARHGMEPGFYLFLNPGSALSVSDQVKGFIDTIKPFLAQSPSGLVIVDIENGKGRVPWRTPYDIEGRQARVRPAREALGAALWALWRALGIRPYIYTNPWFWHAHELVGAAELRPYKLWGSYYQNREIDWFGLESTKVLPDPKSEKAGIRGYGRRVQLWQYGGGPWDGVKGHEILSRSVTPFELHAPLPVFAPFYVGPWKPQLWEEKIFSNGLVGDVVLNPASGPGQVGQPIDVSGWRALRERLRQQGKRALGYIAVNYGQPREPLADQRQRWQEWYGVNEFFYDEWPSNMEAATRLDVPPTSSFVGNPGVPIGELQFSYWLKARFVTWEGTAQDYLGRDLIWPKWRSPFVPDREIHIVHSTPPYQVPLVENLMRARRLGGGWITTDAGDNPYDEE